MSCGYKIDYIAFKMRCNDLSSFYIHLVFSVLERMLNRAHALAVPYLHGTDKFEDSKPLYELPFGQKNEDKSEFRIRSYTIVLMISFAQNLSFTLFYVKDWFTLSKFL